MILKTSVALPVCLRNYNDFTTGSENDTTRIPYDTLLNPTVIIEVLSSSTQAYDRGLKFEEYRTILSLQEYVLIRQDRPYHMNCRTDRFLGFVGVFAAGFR